MMRFIKKIVRQLTKWSWETEGEGDAAITLRMLDEGNRLAARLTIRNQDLCDEMDALVLENERLKNERNELRVASGILWKAVQANDAWHKAHDEYDGYQESELCETNVKALKVFTIEGKVANG